MDFWREPFFRKQPKLLKGGAKQVLALELALPWFRAVCGRLEQKHPTRVLRMQGVLHAEDLQLEARALAAKARTFESAVPCRHARFDGTYAWTEHSIGSRFEPADKVILQQTGSQLVLLNTPDELTDDERRASMLGLPGSGLVAMPDDCERVTLEAGDALYVPLFWPHWGTAHGEASLSVSVVLPAESPLSLFLPMMRDALQHDRRWWKPLPFDESKDLIERRFELLTTSLKEVAIEHRIKETWRGYMLNKEKKADALTPYSGPYMRRPHPVDISSFGVQRGALRAMKDAAHAQVDIPKLMGEVASPDAVRALLGLRAAQALLRHSNLLERAASIFPESTHIQAIADTLVKRQTLDPESVAPCARPEYTSWLWRMGEAIDFGSLRHFDEIASWARRALEPARGPLVRARDGWLFKRYPKGGRFDAPLLDETLSAQALGALTVSVEKANGRLARAWPQGAQVLSSLVSVVLPLAKNQKVLARVVPHFVGAIAIEQADSLGMTLALVSALGRTVALATMEAGLVFDGPVVFESGSARLFEDAAARAYRLIFSRRVGVGLPVGLKPELERMIEAVMLSGQLSKEGKVLVGLLQSAS